MIVKPYSSLECDSTDKSLTNDSLFYFLHNRWRHCHNVTIINHSEGNKVCASNKRLLFEKLATGFKVR